ncbi:hypothetical protein, partial [Thalassospira tepidiphila]|uniref:hypothetical protein n=1 Tax=Thalassospira tepidiphila TaxID=393657 RepID=UPI001AE02C51
PAVSPLPGHFLPSRNHHNHPKHTKGQRTLAALIAFCRHPSAITNANPVIPTQVGIYLSRRTLVKGGLITCQPTDRVLRVKSLKTCPLAIIQFTVSLKNHH